MKNIFNLLGLMMGVAVFHPAAQAELLQPIVEVEADESPGEVYHIGVQVDDQFNVKNFYFQDVDQEVNLYDLEGLKKGLVILKRKGFDVITMKSNYDHVTKKAEVSFIYLVNALTKKTRTASVLIQYNEGSRRHEFIDKKDSHVVTSAFIYSKALGINRIEFQ